VPLYEYRCDKCKRKFSLLEGVTAKKAKRACPKCGSRKLTKLISRIAPIVREEDFDDDLDDDYDDSEFGDGGGNGDDWDDDF
jgi:putative FmdB family regulatory protein